MLRCRAARPKLFTIGESYSQCLDKALFLWYIVTMKATKATFEFTAALISAVVDLPNRNMLAILAGAKFERDNPRFDKDRFMEACDVDLWHGAIRKEKETF